MDAVSPRYYFATVEQVAKLPHLTWETRRELPDAPGLYFVRVGAEVHYIGRSGKSLRERWHQYPLRRVFEEEGVFEVAYLVVRDLDTLKAMERRSIRAMRPSHNFHYVEGALKHWHAMNARRKHRPDPADPTAPG